MLDIHVWAKGPVAEATRNEPDTALERNMDADGTVFVTKRYQVFTDMIPRLIAKGVTFVEIGGNDEIMITVLGKDAITAPALAKRCARAVLAHHGAAAPTPRSAAPG